LIAWIGIGGNQGQPGELLPEVIDALDRMPDIEVLERSSLYRSAPRDYLDQPDFINAAFSLDTELSPHELLQRLQQLEQDYGRRRNGPRYGPRTIDLDILLIDGQCIDSDELVVPHPRLQQREFALAPLAEINPELDVPGCGRVGDLLHNCGEQGVVRL